MNSDSQVEKAIEVAINAFDDSANTQGFGWAIKQMHNGLRVCRVGWNGKGMYLFIVANWARPVDALTDHLPNMPFIAMKSAQDTISPWTPTQNDMLCIDWIIAP